MTLIKLLPDAAITNPMLSGGAEDEVLNDVTASRSFGVVYQNTSGKALFVMIHVRLISASQNSGGVEAKITVDSPQTGQAVLTDQFNNSGSSSEIENQVTFFVPRNWYYSVEDISDGGSATKIRWIEFTE